MVMKMTKRVDAMTDLTPHVIEQLQIQNYGIGGHYDVSFYRTS